MPFRSLLCAVVLAGLLLCGCSADRGPLPDAVYDAWDQFEAEPTENTYLRFIQVNRAAARDHAMPDDAQGVLHQLLALDAQSRHAERNADLRLAQDVVMRVDELEGGGVLETYDEVVPGSRERFLAVRGRVAGMLE